MRRGWVVGVLAVVASAVAGCGGSSSNAAEPLRVLITNDDGVGAAGIAALVQALASDKQLAITVSAPAVNQSGSGDQTTNGPLRVAASMTSNGYAATAVFGYPADSVLFALLGPAPAEPDLIVSGINAGQNIGEYVYLSGTVGAARWGARHGIPAIALSQGLPATNNYGDIASYAAALVKRFRRDANFRKLLTPPDSSTARILNVNFPTCGSGEQRGIVVVPMGRSSQILGYDFVGTNGEESTYQPLVASTNVFASNCNSTLGNPTDDITAMTNGFATLTPLTPDLSLDTDLNKFEFLTKL
jgi:5'/3'-nucleotidase